jgi:hypothetical protein
MERSESGWNTSQRSNSERDKEDIATLVAAVIASGETEIRQRALYRTSHFSTPQIEFWAVNRQWGSMVI